MNTKPKIPSGITKLILNGATFKNEQVEPTLINFFYGNNGTGKSTLARTIDPHDTEFGQDFTWMSGKSANDYSVLVYNDKFVEKNLADYGDLKGVFTVGEENIEIQKEVADKTAEKAEQDKLAGEKTTELKSKETERGKILESFQNDCWDKTKAVRERFKTALSGVGTKVSLSTKILQGGNANKHDEAELETLMQSAFAKSVEEYPKFQAAFDVSTLKGGNELLSKSITSSAETEFATFIKAINATDWVRHGHSNFSEVAGERCPYCRQELPDDFEQQIADCFDEQYDKDIETLKAFYNNYKNVMNSFTNALAANLQKVMPSLEALPEFTEYKDKLDSLKSKIESNIRLIESKIKEPSLAVTLDNVKPIRERINELMDFFNERIVANNSLVDKKAKAAKQSECSTKVWELVLLAVQNEVSSYKQNMKNADADIATLEKFIKTCKDSSSALEAEISELNSKIVNTEKAINNIKLLLKDSGFQGFTLENKKGHKGVYQLVRSDGTVVGNRTLSEGERNFISFLYFCELVKGSHDEKEVGREKIIVIDDPVSSMDSGALFIVSTLVREMLNICYRNVDLLDNQNGDSSIKQIFILTHNVYFHREITYNQSQAERYKHVSFYMINKTENNSSVKLCIRPTDETGGGVENYNPIQNSYAALWLELKEVNSSLAIVNVTRRILEYYFLQLCGYDGADIRRDVLEKNKSKFEDVVEGKVDATRYNLATSMLTYINASSVGVFDGINYVESTATAQEYRDTIRLIFEAMEQEQHYKMMMSL